MANDKHAANTAPAAGSTSKDQVFDPSKGEGLVNLAARFPQYDGGDARTAKVGTFGPAIHGHLLGPIDLPSLIKDPKTGEQKPWRGIVIQLLQPTPIKEKHGEEEVKRMGKPGEKIILTESKVLEAYSRIADHPTKVFETFITPQVSKTQAGQSLWVYPEFKVGRPISRTENHLVGMAMFDEPEQVHAALPVAAGNGANARA
jgi:hypothetical protein